MTCRFRRRRSVLPKTSCRARDGERLAAGVARLLALVVFLAMIASCMASGISGAILPLTLKRFGFDPATASSIFLTTATDVASMGMLLGLATILVR
jgi:Mg/Co/Ni transporter MgtE